MSKREIRVSKQFAAEQRMQLNNLKAKEQQELKDPEGNLLIVAFTALIALIFGSN